MKTLKYWMCLTIIGSFINASSSLMNNMLSKRSLDLWRPHLYTKNRNCKNCQISMKSGDSKIQQNQMPKSVASKGSDTFSNRLKRFLKNNWLVLGEVAVICVAKYNPQLGASGGILKPEFFISKLGVFTIFFINGIALSIGASPSELQTATKVNAIIQLFNFGFMPLAAKLLVPFFPIPAFRDGLIVLSVIPGTINICVAQTLAAGGNMGTAIFNAIFGNVIGVFLTPLLAVLMLGAGKGVSLLGTLRKLGDVVVLPLVLGQICRQTPIGAYAEKVSKLAIVYNVFSDTFLSGLGVSSSALAVLLFSMPITYLVFSAIFWKLSYKLLPGLDAPTRAAALLCSSQRTLAFGIPFIKTAFGTRPDVAYILAPLLLYAPAQLLLGSTLFVPALQKLIAKGQEFETGGAMECNIHHVSKKVSNRAKIIPYVVAGCGLFVLRTIGSIASLQPLLPSILSTLTPLLVLTVQAKKPKLFLYGNRVAIQKRSLKNGEGI